jgi:hypothetical protein
VARVRFGVVSDLDTRWKKAVVGGPHLSVTQGCRPARQWKEERGGHWSDLVGPRLLMVLNAHI